MHPARMLRAVIPWLCAVLLAPSQSAQAAERTQAHSKEHASFTIVWNGFGLSLVVRNPTSASLCIQQRSLEGDSNRLLAFQGGKMFWSQAIREYAPGYPASGLYYVAPKRSTSVFGIDEQGLKLARGTYTFQLHVVWLNCEDLSATGSYRHGELKETIVRRRLNYVPFE